MVRVCSWLKSERINITDHKHLQVTLRPRRSYRGVEREVRYMRRVEKNNRQHHTHMVGQRERNAIAIVCGRYERG